MGKNRCSRESAPIVSYLFRLYILSCTYNYVNIVTNGTTKGKIVVGDVAQPGNDIKAFTLFMREKEKEDEMG